MRFYYLVILFLLTANAFADSLKDLYDPSEQINRNKTSTLSQREFKVKNFSFNQPALFFNKSLSYNQTAPSKRLIWNQTSYFANKKFEKTLPNSIFGNRKNSLELSSSAWQNKKFNAEESYKIPSSPSHLIFRDASGFSEHYPIKEYDGDLPIKVSKALQFKKEKALTIDEIKEILNKNK